MDAQQGTQVPLENVPIDGPYADQSPETQDFSWEDTLNARELGQLIRGTLSGRQQRRTFVKVDEERVAGVIVALVRNGWIVKQREWGGVDKAVVLDVYTD